MGDAGGAIEELTRHQMKPDYAEASTLSAPV